MRDKNRAPQSGGPGREEFQAYLLGELSEEGKLAMESYLAENPMAQDALEGLKWVEQPQKVSKHIRRIQRKTQERLNSRIIPNTPIATKRSSRVRPDIQFNPFLASMAGIAAVILVLFMILWIPNQKAERLANNHFEQGEQKHSDAPLSESEEGTPGSAETPSKNLDRKVTSPSLTPPAIAEARQSAKSTRSLKKEKSMLGEAVLRNKAKKTETLPYPSIHPPYVFDIEKEENLSQDTNLSISKNSEQAPLSSQVFLPYISSPLKKVNMQLSMGKKLSSRSRPPMAEERVSSYSMEELDKIQPTDLPARSQMYLAKPQRKTSNEEVQRTFKANMGIWYFTYERYREAERELYHLLSSSSEVYEQTDWAASSAGWYLSRIYLATGRQGEARRLLKEISTYPNPYRYQAQEVLQKL